MYTQKQALEVIQRCKPQSKIEHEARDFILTFIKNSSRYWSRSNVEGHLTGSAWITNKSNTKAVLLHHKKLNMWLQPGGHIDDGDRSLLHAALREAKEETGIHSFTIASQNVFDVDVHTIPARETELEHQHLDIRFWFVADNEELNISDESNHLRWMTRKEIEQATHDESLLRMVRKSMPQAV